MPKFKVGDKFKFVSTFDGEVIIGVIVTVEQGRYFYTNEDGNNRWFQKNSPIEKTATLMKIDNWRKLICQNTQSLKSVKRKN